MEIVLDKEILNEYFESISPNKKSELAQKLSLAIENENNTIKLSSKYLDIIETYLQNKPKSNIDFFHTFISSLHDDNRIISFISTVNSDDDEELLDEIYNYNYNDFTFLLTKDPLTKINIHNHSIYNNAIKPNKDWFLLSLSTCFVVQLEHSDFNNQNEIENIFQICFNLTTKEKTIHIIDSYLTLNNNSQLKWIKGNGFKIKCYTSSFKKTNDEKKIDRKRIKMYFGSKTSVKFSNNKALLHERKILLNSLLIDSNHDFSELIIKNNNWSIYFIISNEKRINTLNKLKGYN